MISCVENKAVSQFAIRAGSSSEFSDLKKPTISDEKYNFRLTLDEFLSVLDHLEVINFKISIAIINLKFLFRQPAAPRSSGGKLGPAPVFFK